MSMNRVPGYASLTGSVLIVLTDAGVKRLTETVLHLRGVSDMFVIRLDDRELAVLESALEKVNLDCEFG